MLGRGHQNINRDQVPSKYYGVDKKKNAGGG